MSIDDRFYPLNCEPEDFAEFPLWVWSILTFNDELKAKQMEGMFTTMPTEKQTQFDPDEHLIDFDNAPWEPMYDDDFHLLQGIRGKTGATGIGFDGEEIGADLIELQPGASFPLHTHPGDHILYGVSGRGNVTIDGVARLIEPNCTIYIAGDHPHNVGTYRTDIEPFVLLAIGHPKKHVSAFDRMKVIHKTQFINPLD